MLYKSPSYAPEDGRKIAPKHVELILEINKLLLLHLVGSSILLYLYENNIGNKDKRDRGEYNLI